jgi:monoterpene epsilon-lactone hydrolase
MVEQIVATGQRTPEEPPTPELLRVARDAERLTQTQAPDDVLVDDVEIGGVPCVVVTPEGGEPAGTIVYAHGGGYIWMTARTHLAVAVALVRATGCRCVSIDYRRAPEHPFPAPVEDLVAVHTSLIVDGTDPGRIAFAGDSAGGGLVLAGAIAIRDAGLPLPVAVTCFSPWTDLTVTGASADTVDDPIVSGAALRMMASVYLDGAAADEPTASPLHAEVAGLPPMLVQVGTREALLDDSRRFVERARAAGVEVELLELPDVVHMWVVIGPDIPESLEAFRAAGSFITSRLD